MDRTVEVGWDREADIVVVGSGGAGLAAALTAASLGATVELLEKADSVGGTTAVSGGVIWVPAHDREPDLDLPVEDALAYLRAQSLGQMDDVLVGTFVRRAPEAMRYLEAHSPLRLAVAEGFPDYKPELPGGKPGGGRSLRSVPFDLTALDGWADSVTSFPADWSNVGFDAETRARYSSEDDVPPDGRVVVGGAALVAALLRGLLDMGVEPQVSARVVELVEVDGAIVGVVVSAGGRDERVRARRGVILASGGFEWDAGLVRAFLRGPMRGPVSPPLNTGDGLRMAMQQGAALGNMGEAWWVPVVQIPGDEFGGHQRSRSIRLERTRPRSIVVNRLGRRFMNEAGDYNSMGGPFHVLDPVHGYVNDPGWLVFDHEHLVKYGSFGYHAGESLPDWMHASDSLQGLAVKIGVEPIGLLRTVEEWNAQAVAGADPQFGRGSSAYDGWWGDRSAPTTAGQTLGPLESAPFYAVRLTIGSMGTKGGPQTDEHGRVQRIDGGPLPGLYAAGNVMAGVTGKAYGGAGGTIGPGLTWGYIAAMDALRGDDAGRRVDETIR